MWYLCEGGRYCNHGSDSTHGWDTDWDTESQPKSEKTPRVPCKGDPRKEAACEQCSWAAGSGCYWDK